MKARKKDIVSSSSKNLKKRETSLKKNNLNGMQEKHVSSMNDTKTSNQLGKRTQASSTIEAKATNRLGQETQASSTTSSKLDKAKQSMKKISSDSVAYTVKKGADVVHSSLEKSDSDGVVVSSQAIKGTVRAGTTIREKQKDHKLRKKEIQQKLKQKEFVLKKEVSSLESKLHKEHQPTEKNISKLTKATDNQAKKSKLAKTTKTSDKTKRSQKNVILKNQDKHLKLSTKDRQKVEKVLNKKKQEIKKINKTSKLKINSSAVGKNALNKVKATPTTIVQKSAVSYQKELEKSDSDGVKLTSQSASTLAKATKKLAKASSKQTKSSKKLRKASKQTKSSVSKFQKKTTPNVSKVNQKKLQKKRLVKKSMLDKKKQNPYFGSNVLSRINHFFKNKKFSLNGVRKELGKKLSVAFGGGMGALTPIFIVVSVFLLLGSLLGVGSSLQQEQQAGGGKQLSPQVERYRPLVETEAKAQGMEEYISLILAIIQVESNGMGNDIMQSSESAGYGRPNVFQTPEESVRQGIRHMKQIVNILKAYNKDYEKNMKLIAQSYNYGVAFASYVGNKGGEYTIEVAEEYSKNVVAPSLGNTSGQTYSYINEVSTSLGKPYLYFNGGNFMYGDLVNQYLGFGGGSGDYVLPVDNPIISSPFGYRTSPLGGHGEFHRGLDFANPYGTPIKAIQGGRVITAEFHYSWGNHVVILHEDGKVSLYAHQSQMLVKVGDIVQTGQPIGKIGSTGDSTGPHLHLEISQSTNLSQSNLIDPAIVLGI